MVDPRPRPQGLRDKRFNSAYIFAAVRPSTGEGFALVLALVSTEAMNLFLAGLSREGPANTHAVVVLDGAGWHGAKAPKVPDNLSLVRLPPYAPELNPVEQVWLYLREPYLSHRRLDDYDAVLHACCEVWKALVAETGRIQSLCSYPYLKNVSS